jgi:GTP pyrophosphokinase
VITPQGKVIDLPGGATPVDFAYTLHTDLGHRVRGAKRDGQMVKLDQPLQSGQRVEIIAAKTGGPSRDWLNPRSVSSRASARAARCASGSTRGSSPLPWRRAAPPWKKEQRREGALNANLEQLAHKLGFGKPDELFRGRCARRGQPAPAARGAACLDGFGCRTQD